jgi:hypothetical protein
VPALSTVTNTRAACKVTEDDAVVGAEHTLNRMTFGRQRLVVGVRNGKLTDTYGSFMETTEVLGGSGAERG